MTAAETPPPVEAPPARKPPDADARETARIRTMLGLTLALILGVILAAAGLAAFFASGGALPAPLIGMVGLGGALVAVLLVVTGRRGKPRR